MSETRERRRFQRVHVPLLGRYMLEDRREYPCQIVNMSAGGIAVRAPENGKPGERIVMYIDTLGRVEGEIVRISPEGFALQLKATQNRREKIIDTLTWLLNKERFLLPETRRHERTVPRDPATKLKLSDGTEVPCRVLDVSIGGAAVDVEPKPPIGACVMLGRTAARVVRHGDYGISLKFIENQDHTDLADELG